MKTAVLAVGAVILGLGAGTGLGGVKVKNEILATRAAEELALAEGGEGEHGYGDGFDLEHADAEAFDEGRDEEDRAGLAVDGPSTSEEVVRDASPSPGSAAASTQPAAAASTPAADDEGQRRLGKIFGAMSPSDAAAVLAEMNDPEVEAILSTMSDRQAAAVLSNLSRDRAAKLSRAVLGAGSGRTR